MNLSSLFFLFLILFSFPSFVFAFSESELDALESSGTIKSTPSPWRTALSFRLQRSANINTFHATSEDKIIYASDKEQSLLDKNQDNSLVDFSNLYYAIGININYTPLQIAEKFHYDWLKNTEFFFSGSFSSPITGYKNKLTDYNALKYMHYAIGDLKAGFTRPLYKKDKFISYFNSSVILFPLNRFSWQAGLFSGVTGSVSLLYFLKQESKQSWAVSSSHGVTYRRYNKDSADVRGRKYNVPFGTSQTGSIIFRQSKNKWLPANLSFSTTHSLRFNKYKTWVHYLFMRISSSWKVKDRFYINSSIRWQDSIYEFHKTDKKIAKTNLIGWNRLDHYIISFGGSLSL